MNIIYFGITHILRTKMRDENSKSMELRLEQYKTMKDLEKIHVKNSKPYRKIMKDLRREAHKVKAEQRKKYEAKLENLKSKFRLDEDDKMRMVPDGLEDFKDLSIFDIERFEDIKTQKYDSEIIGDVELTENEINLLQMHPKFSVIET